MADEDSAVILGSRDLRQDARWLNGQELHVAITMVGLTARKRRLAGKVSQCIDIETRLGVGFHVRSRRWFDATVGFFPVGGRPDFR